MSETDALAHPPGTRAVPTTPPHSIRSAQELHEALTAGEPGRRLGALQAIISRPDAARRLGVHAGLDVIALLLQQETRMRGCLEWLSWVGALAAFRDPRVSAFFIELLRTAEQPDILFAAARYLSSEPSAQLYPSLSPLLLQHTCVPRARAVAQVLAGCAVLSPAERLRVALLAPAGGSAAPQLDQTTADCWLTELQGPYRLAAQTGLQAQGESAFAALCGLWERLDDDARSWLVGWGVRAFPSGAGPLVERALSSGSARVALVALEGLAELPQGGARFTALLTRVADHPEPALRRAAILAGVPGLDWRQRLVTEADPAVRRACVPRLAEAEGLQALPALIGLLHETDWQMRAVATQALIGLGEAVVEPVKPLVHDSAQGVQVAAVQVLLAFGQETWLAESGPGRPAPPKTKS